MINIRRCLVGALALSAGALTVLSPAQAADSKKHPAAAASPKPATSTRSLGHSDAWTAYASQDKTGRVCYWLASHRRAKPAGSGQEAADGDGDASPGRKKITNVVSFVEGYPLKDGSDVALDISGDKIPGSPRKTAPGRAPRARQGDRDGAGEGKSAVVKGRAAEGSPTTDIYPLAGFARRSR